VSIVRRSERIDKHTMIRKLPLPLLLLATFMCGFAHAQSFEILDGNLRITTLDGLWRFHTGDDPTWPTPKFDDSQWPLLRSNEDWALQGYQTAAQEFGQEDDITVLTLSMRAFRLLP
jgi:hypothetical protein